MVSVNAPSAVPGLAVTIKTSPLQGAARVLLVEEPLDAKRQLAPVGHPLVIENCVPELKPKAPILKLAVVPPVRPTMTLVGRADNTPLPETASPGQRVMGG